MVTDVGTRWSSALQDTSPVGAAYEVKALPFVVLTDRERYSPGRTGAALLWAIGRVAPESLVVRPEAWDERFGRPRMREALLRGDDPDEVVRADSGAVSAFGRAVARFELYR